MTAEDREELFNDLLHEAADARRLADAVSDHLSCAEGSEVAADLAANLRNAAETAADVAKQLTALAKRAAKLTEGS